LTQQVKDSETITVRGMVWSRDPFKCLEF